MLASACIFASNQFGATAWLIENAQKIQTRYSLPSPNSSIQPSGSPGSSIAFIGDGEGRTVAFESEGDQETFGDLGPAFRIAEGTGNALAENQAVGIVDSSTEYLAMPDGEIASTHPADLSNSEGTDASTLEPFIIGGVRNAPSENQSSGGASRMATVETAPEVASSGAANPEDMRTFKLNAAAVERNADAAIQPHAASAPDSRVAQSLAEQAFSATAGDNEEGTGSPLEVGVPHNLPDNGMSGKPTDLARQVSLSGDNQNGPSENSASLLSDEIASFDSVPDASVKAANATVHGSIFDDGDYPNSADLNSLRSELESELAELHSRLDLMAARFDLLIAGHESGPALRGGTKASGAPAFESQDDANAAGEMDCQHPPDRFRQNCEAGSRTGKSSQPYLIATASNAAGGEFAMPELGYGVVLDVLKDSAGGWLIVMENATLRLD